MHFSKQPYLIHISLAQIYNKKSIGSIPLNQFPITLPKKQLNPKKHGNNQPHQPTAHHPLLRLYLRQYFCRVAEIKKLIINRSNKHDITNISHLCYYIRHNTIINVATFRFSTYPYVYSHWFTREVGAKKIEKRGRKEAGKKEEASEEIRDRGFSGSTRYPKVSRWVRYSLADVFC